MTENDFQAVTPVSLSVYVFPSEGYRQKLADYIEDADVRATANEVLARSLKEMVSVGGNEIGLLAVFAHVLGQVAAVYRVEANLDIRAVLFSAIGRAIEIQEPDVAARRNELTRPRIVTP